MSLLNFRSLMQPDPTVRDLQDENAQLKDAITHMRKPSIPAPRVSVDSELSLRLSLEDISNAPPEVLQCALRLLGMYLSVDDREITRVFGVINQVASVSNGQGATVLKVMDASDVRIDQADDLSLVMGAVLTQIMAYRPGLSAAFASSFLQLRGARVSYNSGQPNARTVNSGPSNGFKI